MSAKKAQADPAEHGDSDNDPKGMQGTNPIKEETIPGGFSLNDVLTREIREAIAMRRQIAFHDRQGLPKPGHEAPLLEIRGELTKSGEPISGTRPSNAGQTGHGNGLPPKTRQNQNNEGLLGEKWPNDLVGLALSGGGVRSAFFNLGLLQSFTKSGLMRYVDYLSSVSGGGYIAAYYSTAANNYAQKQADGLPLADHQAVTDIQKGNLERSWHDRPGVKSGLIHANGDDSFIWKGRYLWEPILALSCWISQTLVTALLLLAGLGVFAALIALAYRSFDYDPVRQWMRLFGFRGDFWAACMPSVIIFGSSGNSVAWEAWLGVAGA